MKFRSSLRVEPMKPTLEGDMAEIIRNLKPMAVHQFAPPEHTDRVSASAQIMCDGIDRLFAGASDENQKIINQCEAALSEMRRFKTLVDDGMREAADGLKKHLLHVMGLLEDGTAKIQQNPFNGDSSQSDESKSHEV